MVKTLKQHIITTALKGAFQREARSPIPLPLSAASSSPFAPPCQWPGLIVTTGCSQESSEAVQHVPGSPAGGVSLGCFMGERVSLMAETLAGSHGPGGSWDKVCTSCLCDVAGQVPRPLTVMCLCGQPALTISSSHVGTQLCIMSLPQCPLTPNPNPAASIHVHWHHSLCLDTRGPQAPSSAPRCVPWQGDLPSHSRTACCPPCRLCCIHLARGPPAF